MIASYTDNFNRSNQTLQTSPNWIKQGTSDLGIVSNAINAAIGVSQSGLYRWNGSVGADQYCQVYVVNPTYLSPLGCMVRVPGSGLGGYVAEYTAAFTRYRIYCVNADGTSTLVASATGTGLTPIGRTIRLVAAGNVILLYCDDVLITSGLNSTWPTGSIGVGGIINTFNTTFNFDDFAGGDIASLATTSPYIRLVSSQVGALTTRLFHLPGYQTAGEGVLLDMARVGHGMLMNGALFAAAPGSWTNAWKGLPFGGPVLNLNGTNQYTSIGTLTGCLPAINAGGISGSFTVRPGSVTGTRTIWGHNSGGNVWAYCALDAGGGFLLNLSDGTHITSIVSDAAIIAVNENKRIDYSLAPDGTGFIMVDGVVVPSSVILDWPTLIDPTVVGGIALGVTNAASPSGYFAGEIAEHEVRFGQTKTPAQAMALNRLSRGMKKRGLLGNLTLGI